MNALNLNVRHQDYAPIIAAAGKTVYQTKSGQIPRSAADITRITAAGHRIERKSSASPFFIFKAAVNRTVTVRPARATGMVLPMYPSRKKNAYSHFSRIAFLPKITPASFFLFSFYAIAAAVVITFFTFLTAFSSTYISKWRLSTFASNVVFAHDSSLTGNMYGYVLPPKDITEKDIPLGTGVLPQVSYQSYTVRNGDTVSGITARFGLRNISTLLSVNTIENARRLRNRQTLRIPSMDGIMHTVTAGDSVSSVAKKYSISETALMDVNVLESSVLVSGSQLFIPGAALNKAELKKILGETFVFPVNGRLTSPYGYRNDPFTGVRKFHTGIDIANRKGTPIRAALDGKVSVIGHNGVYGNYVIMVHSNNYQTLYAHLDSVSVKKGQYLDARDMLGKMGSTGYSTGSHLHFSVYKNGSLINPFSVLDRGKLKK